MGGEGRHSLMNFLFSSAIAALVTAFLAVRIYDYLVAGLAGFVVQTARATLFVTTGAAIATASGMRGFTQRVRRLRHVHRVVSSIIAPPKRGD